VVTGLLAIQPALSVAETTYLTQFCESRRWDRPGGPYAVPANPAAECLDAQLDMDAFVRPASGQPSLYCPWLPGPDGRSLRPKYRPLVSDGSDAAGEEPGPAAAADRVVAWLAYLYEHFFAPDARLVGVLPAAGADGFDGFEPHDLAGAVAVSDPRTGRLDAVVVHGGRIECRLVHAGWSRGLQLSA